MSLIITACLAAGLIQTPVAVSPTASISGYVVEDGTGNPIAGARISLMPSDPPAGQTRGAFLVALEMGTTDDEGRFAIYGLHAGRYRITIEKPGFVLLDGRATPVIVLSAGEHRADVGLTLHTASAITGRAVDARGNAVVHAQVWALREQSQTRKSASAARLRAVAASTISDDVGEFRLLSLVPGTYYIQVIPRVGSATSPAHHATTLRATYFPDTRDPAAAQRITLDAGQTIDKITVQVMSVPAFRISGIVRDERRKPVANAMIMISEAVGVPMLSHTRSDASGHFTIDSVASGTYIVTAIAPPGTAAASSQVGARVPIRVKDANVSGLDVVVRPQGR